jgi:hypothetical protein
MSELAQARDIAAALLSFDPNTPCDEVRKTMERHNQDCCLRAGAFPRLDRKGVTAGHLPV